MLDTRIHDPEIAHAVAMAGRYIRGTLSEYMANGFLEREPYVKVALERRVEEIEVEALQKATATAPPAAETQSSKQAETYP